MHDEFSAFQGHTEEDIEVVVREVNRNKFAQNCVDQIKFSKIERKRNASRGNTKGVCRGRSNVERVVGEGKNGTNLFVVSAGERKQELFKIKTFIQLITFNILCLKGFNIL
jgi:hypothetical protein